MIPILESKLTLELRQEWKKELVEEYNDDEFAMLERFNNWYLKQVRSREVADNASVSRTDDGGASW